MEEMEIESLESWGFGEGPLIIAGPCSAENEEQVIDTARALKEGGRVKVFRSGIWKPRSRPGSFTGEGAGALFWLRHVKQETGLGLAVEVVSPKHVEACLRHGVDVVWLGARTVSNPYSVDEIVRALQGTPLAVLVKNPLGPDVELWQGAVERVYSAGIRKIAGVHRGFTPFERTHYRNIPKWELAIELRSRIPSLPVICDPSHMAGKADLVPEVAQKALDMNMSGLMIEVHVNPEKALSDIDQQLTPEHFEAMMQNLIFRAPTSGDQGFRNILDELRNRIDSIDSQIIELLASRMNVSEKMGEYKCRENVAVFQLNRWLEILRTRVDHGLHQGLDKEFVENIIKVIHEESIRRQEEVMDAIRRSGLSSGRPENGKEE